MFSKTIQYTTNNTYSQFLFKKTSEFNRKNKIMALSIFFAIGLFLPQKGIAGTLVEDSILISGIFRHYYLFLPANYSPNQTYPLVFNLHARGSTATEHMPYTQMNLVADTAGFVVVHPFGLKDSEYYTWNYAGHHSWSDIDFISALIDKLVNNAYINPDKVFACGLSNGGFMSYTLACKLPNKIAAIAVVGGGFGLKPLANYSMYSFDSSTQKSVLIIHGTNDLDVDYDGVSPFYAGVDATFNFWKERNGCNGDVTMVEFPDIDNTDQSTITKFSYHNCYNQNEVVLFRVNDGGHSWPGSLGTVFPELLPKNRDINASSEIWNFFKSKVLITSSITQIPAEEQFEILPNPVTNWITIDGNSAPFGVTILDKTGKTRKGKHSGLSKYQIDCTDLEQGLYFIRVQWEEKIFTRKFIKL
jgi:polyhydroxybutyrate depolymerase